MSRKLPFGKLNPLQLPGGVHPGDITINKYQFPSGVGNSKEANSATSDSSIKWTEKDKTEEKEKTKNIITKKMTDLKDHLQGVPRSSVSNQYFAPDEAGDLVILMKDSATKKDVKKTLLRILSTGLTPRLQSLQNAVRNARNTKETNKGYTCCFGQCECCTNECCHAKCVTRGEGCLGNILPPCVTQHAVENTSFDYVIFVTASKERLQEENRLLQIDDWLQSNIVTNVNLLMRDGQTDDNNLYFSVSERTYLLFRAIHRSSSSGGAGLRGSQFDSKNPIALIFTMHDASFLNLMSESLVYVPKFETVLKDDQKLKLKNNASVLKHGMMKTVVEDNYDSDEDHHGKAYFDHGKRKVLPAKLQKIRSAAIQMKKKYHSWTDWWRSFYLTFNQLFLGDVNMKEIRMNTLRCIRHHPDAPLNRSEFFVHEIRHQYGDHIGWFFAYNRHFLRHLYPPAVLGLGVTLFTYFINDNVRVHQAQLVFAVLLTAFWAPFYLADWKRKCHVLRWRWKMSSNADNPDSFNPDFYGEPLINETTGQVLLYFPSWKRFVVTVIRFSFVLAFWIFWGLLAILFMLVFIMFRAHYDSPHMDMLNLLKDAIHGIVIAFLGTLLFKGTTEFLVKIENFPSEKVKDQTIRWTFFGLDFWNFAVGLLVFSLIFQPLRHSGVLAHAIATNGTKLHETYLSFHGVHPQSFEVVQGRFKRESFGLIMMGPVIIARIFITFFTTILPYLVQSRRRTALVSSLSHRWSKLSGDVKDSVNQSKLIRPLFSDKSKSRLKTFHTRSRSSMKRSSMQAKSTHSLFDVHVGVAHKRKKKEKFNTLVGSGSGKKKQVRQHDLQKSHYMPRIKKVQLKAKQSTLFTAADIKHIINIQKIFRAAVARTRVKKKILALKQADEIVEEAGLNDLDDFIIYIDLTAQLAILLFFGVAGPWVPFAMLIFNTIDLRVRIIALLFSYRVPKVKREFCIREWESFISIVFFLSLVIMPMITMYSGPYFDSFFSDCFENGAHRGIMLDPYFTQLYLNGLYWIIGGETSELTRMRLPPMYIQSKVLNGSLKTDVFFNDTNPREEFKELYPCLSNTVKMWYMFGTITIGLFNYFLLQKTHGCPPAWLRIERERRIFMSKNEFISKAMQGKSMERRHQHAKGYSEVIHKLSSLRTLITNQTPATQKWANLVKKASTTSGTKKTQ